MTDIHTQRPLLAVDLRPRPLGFNERLALAEMSKDISRLCLMIAGSRDVHTRERLARIACSEQVQLAELVDGRGE